MNGAIAEEVVSGGAYTETKGGAVFHFLQRDNDTIMVGCGPASSIDGGVARYLDDNFFNQVRIAGEVVTDDLFGLCIESPRIVSSSQNEKRSKQRCDLSGYSQLSIKGDIQGEDLCVLQAIFEGVYWDPVYETSVKSMAGVHKFMLTRDFKLIIKPLTDSEGRVQGADLIFKERGGLFAVKLPVVFMEAIKSQRPTLYQQLRARSNYSRKTTALFSFNSAALTHNHLLGNWKRIEPYDWMNFLRPAIQGGYVSEAK